VSFDTALHHELDFGSGCQCDRSSVTSMTTFKLSIVRFISVNFSDSAQYRYGFVLIRKSVSSFNNFIAAIDVPSTNWVSVLLCKLVVSFNEALICQRPLR
jgi:hypothetical protein